LPSGGYKDKRIKRRLSERIKQNQAEAKDEKPRGAAPFSRVRIVRAKSVRRAVAPQWHRSHTSHTAAHYDSG